MQCHKLYFSSKRKQYLSGLACLRRIQKIWHEYCRSDFGDNRKNQEKFPNYRNLAYVTVSSPEISWAYEEAMNLKNTDTQIVATGISRTDVFYDKNFIESAAEAVYSVCPKARSKKNYSVRSNFPRQSSKSSDT